MCHAVGFLALHVHLSRKPHDCFLCGVFLLRIVLVLVLPRLIFSGVPVSSDAPPTMNETEPNFLYRTKQIIDLILSASLTDFPLGFFRIPVVHCGGSHYPVDGRRALQGDIGVCVDVVASPVRSDD